MAMSNSKFKPVSVKKWDYKNADIIYFISMKDIVQSLIGSIYSWRKN